MGDCEGHLALGYAVLYFFDVRFIHAGKGIDDGVLSVREKNIFCGMHEVFFSALRSPHLLVDDAHSVYFLFSFLLSKKTPVRSKLNNIKKSPVGLGAYKTSFKLVTA